MIINTQQGEIQIMITYHLCYFPNEDSAYDTIHHVSNDVKILSINNCKYVVVNVKDLNIKVCMDYFDGKWSNPKWVNETAVQKVFENLNYVFFKELLSVCKKAYEESGSTQAKKNIVAALGL